MPPPAKYKGEISSQLYSVQCIFFTFLILGLVLAWRDDQGTDLSQSISLNSQNNYEIKNGVLASIREGLLYVRNDVTLKIVLRS